MREVCIIFNPTAGKNRAGRRLESLRMQRPEGYTFWPTEKRGHAVDLAKKAALEGFHTVAAAGGDGTVHEVANGLLSADRPDAHFAVLPIGSANDFAYSLFLLPEQTSMAIDVGLARAEDGRQRYFLCNLGLGFNGAVTLESRNVPWFQGIGLYGIATVRALWKHFDCPTMEIELDDQPPWSTPTFLFSVLLGKREGGFVLAPQAQLDDGKFDYVHAGRLSRLQVLALLPRLAISGPPDHPQIRQGQCQHVRIRSEKPQNCHLDGEFLCTAADGLREFEVELLPKKLKVDLALSRQWLRE